METDLNPVAPGSEETDSRQEQAGDVPGMNSGDSWDADTHVNPELDPAREEAAEPAAPLTELDEMLRAGVHLGHLRSRGNPKMKSFIFTTRNELQFIDVSETARRLEAARAFLRGVAASGGGILLVGTRPAARRIVRELAESLGLPHVTTRWLGGTLTNFKTISKRLAEKAELERQRAGGEFAKYTKKEALMLERKLEKLDGKFGGIATLSRLPQAVVIFDLSENATAAREAKRLGIPTVAVVDTNADPGLVTHPIPANDDAVSAVRYVAEKIGEAIREGEVEHARLVAERARAEAEANVNA